MKYFAAAVVVVAAGLVAIARGDDIFNGHSGLSSKFGYTTYFL